MYFIFGFGFIGSSDFFGINLYTSELVSPRKSISMEQTSYFNDQNVAVEEGSAWPE